MAQPENHQISVCPKCGAHFSCAMAAGIVAEPCWCTGLPALPAQALQPQDPGGKVATCYCPQCLQKEIAGQ